MKLLSALFALATVLLVAARPSAARPPGRDQLVAPGIWRLDGMDPGLPPTDLAPLRQILEGAQVVGLGESVHTSGGYYRMKHRLFRFLVEEMGFRAFAFETPWHSAQNTARYVATCEGTSADAIRNLIGVWQSREVLELLEWMCAWNQAHPTDPVRFFGFDTQQGRADGTELIAFLRGLGLPDSDPRIDGVRQCDSVVVRWSPRLVPDEVHQACLAGLDAVDRLLDEMDHAPAVQSSREDIEWMKIRAIGLRAWEGQSYYRRRSSVLSFEARDRGMATVFQRMRTLLAGSARTAIWAANAHLAKNARLTLPWETMGTHLDREMGHKFAYVALASPFPSIDWPGIGCGPDLTFEESIEWHLLPLGEPFLLVDVDANGTNPAHPPYLNPDEERLLGWNYYIPRHQVDAIVYLEESPAMIPLAWPACQ